MTNMPENIESASLEEAEINIRGVKTYSRMGLGYAAFLIVGTIAAPRILTYLLSFIPFLSGSYLLGLPLNYFCLYLIGFPIMYLIIRKLPAHSADSAPAQKLSIPQILALYPISYAVITIVSLIVSLVETYIIGSSGTITADDLISSGTPQVLFLIFGCLVAPVMEEIVYRWLPYKKLSGYGIGLYIVWSSIVFGLIHMNFGQAIYAIAIGLVFAKITSVTGSIKYTIILHTLVNLTGGVGIGGYVLASDNETALAIYSVYVTILMILGVILGVMILIKFRDKLKTAEIHQPMTNSKRAFLNIGSILYYIISVGVIILLFFI